MMNVLVMGIKDPSGLGISGRVGRSIQLSFHGKYSSTLFVGCRRCPSLYIPVARYTTVIQIYWVLLTSCHNYGQNGTVGNLLTQNIRFRVIRRCHPNLCAAMECPSLPHAL